MRIARLLLVVIPSATAGNVVAADLNICPGSPIPSGYVWVDDVPDSNCPSNYALVIRVPGAEESICAGQPIPTGYVQIGSSAPGAGSRCPSGTIRIKRLP